jgi:CRP-like cAMP-binding protein
VITTVEKLLFLKGVALFADVPGEDLAQIALIAEELDAEPGAELVREGEAGDALYLVIEGNLRVLKAGREVSALSEREVFGEMALLDAAPRSATVQARSEVRLLRVHREEFAELLAERPEVARGIIQVLVRRLREAGAR